jgi:uncharacterized membrane protein
VGRLVVAWKIAIAAALTTAEIMQANMHKEGRRRLHTRGRRRRRRRAAVVVFFFVVMVFVVVVFVVVRRHMALLVSSSPLLSFWLW